MSGNNNLGISNRLSAQLQSSINQKLRESQARMQASRPQEREPVENVSQKPFGSVVSISAAAGLDGDRGQVIQEFRELQRLNGDLVQAKSQLQRELDQQKTENEMLQSDIQRLGAAQQEAQETIGQLRAQEIKLRADVQHYLKQIQRIQETAGAPQLQQQLDEKASQLAQLREQLASEQSTHERLVEEKDGQINAMASQITSLQEELQDQKETAVVLEQQLETMNARFVQLMQENAQPQSPIRVQDAAQTQELLKQLHILQSDKQVLLDKIQTLKSQSSLDSVSKAQQAESIRDLQALNASLQVENEQLTKKIDALNERHKKQLETLYAEQQKNTSLQYEVEQFQKRLDGVSVSKDEAAYETHKLRKEMQQLTQSLHASDEIITGLKRQKEDLLRQVAQLQIDLQQKQTHTETQQAHVARAHADRDQAIEKALQADNALKKSQAGSQQLLKTIDERVQEATNLKQRLVAAEQQKDELRETISTQMEQISTLKAQLSARVEQELSLGKEIKMIQQAEKSAQELVRQLNMDLLQAKNDIEATRKRAEVLELQIAQAKRMQPTTEILEENTRLMGEANLLREENAALKRFQEVRLSSAAAQLQMQERITQKDHKLAQSEKRILELAAELEATARERNQLRAELENLLQMKSK